jgi:hypothetical protein
VIYLGAPLRCVRPGVADFSVTRCSPRRPLRAPRTETSRLAVVIGPSVTSDAVEKVPTGGELTRFEAVGRARA